MTIAVVGAGLSGAVIAQQLAASGYKVEVLEQRNHVAGMCYTRRINGVMVHEYGPHIFHTDMKSVWDYVNRFANFKPYIHRAKIVADDRVYSFPINLHTINQYYGKNMSPGHAREFIRNQGEDIKNPKNMEEQAISLVGYDLYYTFIQGYTWKQWGRDPKELPASIIKRLPVRFTYDDNYFFHKYQGIPEHGYTAMVERILDHPNIKVWLQCPSDRYLLNDYEHIFWTGSIDAYFGHELGRLPYRTIDFMQEEHEGDYQGCAIINEANPRIAHTRTVEHKHFSPWEDHKNTIIHREFSRECLEYDDPLYPIRMVNGEELIGKYEKLAENESNVTFVGRLGTYRYLDMDQTIKEALETANKFVIDQGSIRAHNPD